MMYSAPKKLFLSNFLSFIVVVSIFKELYLAYNDICEVSPLTMLDTLEVLDLEG